MKTKTIKTPLMKAVAFGPTSWAFGLVSKSELLHSPEAQDGFVPKHSLHGGKNTALRAEKPYINVHFLVFGSTLRVEIISFSNDGFS